MDCIASVQDLEDFAQSQAQKQPLRLLPGAEAFLEGFSKK